MNKLSILVCASVILFGTHVCQANEDPVPMEVEWPEPGQPVVSSSGAAPVTPTQTVVSGGGTSAPFLRRVLRTGAPTPPGGDFFAGQ